MREVVKISNNLFIPRNRIIAILPVSSTVARKLRGMNKVGGKIVNMTFGGESKTILIMDSGHVFVLSKTLEEVDEALWS
ncbi:hypothetical protein SU69_05365 [Thermosipho melanesiensis]|uniref:DUF370 domain-containing protein n=2 Tax=Thermosipho melanesiensis TaxID=46541 RepID=A6LLV8_THEM4|nr:DUF370 domain-containing protein [Thermosipho melanesiensis]ABR30909.1 hypothetical protein Tmel_1048 [Thermosipho melanesiensis BI429]APT74028.1 hypothetical protein BW47_05605 [Thermosipho melanesiensis]OOC35956.1 hypothetical protein SU68_05420 [Thermosipho melanesiensis]OOC38458.1 hypothetical protein SU69_05365 [Thermosipho melanesiensis]OOC38919.1 hypothetical protein SU70_05365 [Thermosipho melanesiensis]